MKKLSLWRRTLAVFGLRQAPPLSQLNRPIRRGAISGGRRFRRPVVEQLEDRALLAALSIGPSGLHVAEGGTATLQVSISPPQMQPTMFTYRTVSGTAIGGTDYQDIPSGNGSIPPGASFANVSIQALTDSITDLAETFSVELLSASGGTINPAAGSTVVTIDNVEPAGGGSGGGSATLSLSAPTDVNEGAGFVLTAQISIPGTYQVNATIDWGATPGTGATNFNGMTNADGSFTIGHQYFDDGPANGNGTLQDTETITLTGTATKYTMQGPIYIPLSGIVSTTIHNVAPNPVFDIYNYMPIGGPEWVVSGTYQDVGITDKATITVDWGDGSDPLIFANVDTGFTFNTNSCPHRYPPEGISYTITITVTDDDTGTASFSKPAPLYLFDLDNDANNNGEIAASDEPYEPVTPDEYPAGPHIAGPGRYISVNADDDNEDGIADMDQLGPISGENDLEPFLIRWRGDMRPDIDNYAGWHILLQVPQQQPDWAFLNPRIWFNPDKSPGPLELDPDGNGRLDLDELNAQFAGKDWTIGDLQDPIAATLYVEARQTGGIELQLHLSTPTGEPVEGDTIAFTAIAADTDVDLIIHDGQGGIAISDADEDKTGAVTVANRNDTDADSTNSNGNSKRDFEDPDGVIETRTGAQRHGRNEVDLMLLEIRRPVGYVAGTVATIRVNAADRVRFWKESTKVNLADNYDTAEGIVQLSWLPGTGTKNLWVEILTKSTTVGDIQIDIFYGASSDTVVATGVWAEVNDYELSRKSWDDLEGTKWRSDEVDDRVQISLKKFNGTGEHIIVYPNTNIDTVNGIIMQVAVFPNNVTEKLSRVKFDPTRQIAKRLWTQKVDDAGPVKDEGKSFDFPQLWEDPNDDPDNFDESEEPSPQGHMFIWDGPGVGPLTTPPGAVRGYWLYQNFFEYVRVTFNGSRPVGDEDQTILGSQCSGNFAWHSQTYVRWSATNGTWVRAGAAGVNDIDIHLIEPLGDLP